MEIIKKFKKRNNRSSFILVIKFSALQEYVEVIMKYIEKLNDDSDTQSEDENDIAPESEKEANDETTEVEEE